MAKTLHLIHIPLPSLIEGAMTLTPSQAPAVCLMREGRELTKYANVEVVDADGLPEPLCSNPNRFYGVRFEMYRAGMVDEVKVYWAIPGNEITASAGKFDNGGPADVKEGDMVQIVLSTSTVFNAEPASRRFQ